jgi:hypothetical protein
VPNKKRWHPMIDFDDILLIVIKDDNILELQGLLEHKDFTNKLATKIAHAMLIYVLNKHNSITKKKTLKFLHVRISNTKFSYLNSFTKFFLSKTLLLKID